MTKADLAAAIYLRHGGLSRREAREMVDVILNRIRRHLAAGRTVRISGFGSFQVVRRSPRPGRNPRTGAVVPIPGRSRAVFRPAGRVLRHLNGPGGPE